MAVSIRIENLVKYFGDVHAVDHVSLTIEPGEIFFLLGPSGCGKTTLLRSIAGFHNADEGRIFIGDDDVTSLPPHKRDTGMVFQSYALWPHMTVEENVAFGLGVRHVSKEETRRRVAKALESVHMADRAKYKPNQLSGGQQQRVALARALVIEPRCLLLDEPLSNLDAKLRLEMRSEIRRICKESGLTAIYVTHDQKEALSIADRLAVLQGGHIEQIGTPAEVYRRPCNPFVAGFIGEANFIKGKVVETSGRHVVVASEIGRIKADAGNVMRSEAAGSSADVTLCIRPEGIKVRPSGDAVENIFSSKLRRFSYQGDIAQYQLDVPRGAVGGGGEVAISAVELGPQSLSASFQGEELKFAIDPEQVVVL